MDVLSQGDFGRLARGGTLDEQLERALLMMSNYARSAARRVHNESVERARAYLSTNLVQFRGGPADATASSYLRSLETYVEWDATADPADKGVQVEISFAPDGVIRGRADMVFIRGHERYAGRLLLWDDLPMNRTAAEIIGLPSLRAVEQRHPVGTVDFVDIWQLRTRERERVNAASAAAREDDVRRILRELDL